MCVYAILFTVKVYPTLHSTIINTFAGNRNPPQVLVKVSLYEKIVLLSIFKKMDLVDGTHNVMIGTEPYIALRGICV